MQVKSRFFQCMSGATWPVKPFETDHESFTKSKKSVGGLVHQLVVTQVNILYIAATLFDFLYAHPRPRNVPDLF
jgi:hypothetical protein